MNQADFEFKFFKPYPGVKKLAIDMGYVLVAPLAFSVMSTACVLISALGLVVTLLSPLLLASAIPFSIGMVSVSRWLNPEGIVQDTQQSQSNPENKPSLSAVTQFASDLSYHIGHSMLLALGITFCAIMVSAITLVVSLLATAAILLSPFFVSAGITSCLVATGIEWGRKLKQHVQAGKDAPSDGNAQAEAGFQFCNYTPQMMNLGENSDLSTG